MHGFKTLLVASSWIGLFSLDLCVSDSYWNNAFVHCMADGEEEICYRVDVIMQKIGSSPWLSLSRSPRPDFSDAISKKAGSEFKSPTFAPPSVESSLFADSVSKGMVDVGISHVQSWSSYPLIQGWLAIAIAIDLACVDCKIALEYDHPEPFTERSAIHGSGGLKMDPHRRGEAWNIAQPWLQSDYLDGNESDCKSSERAMAQGQTVKSKCSCFVNWRFVKWAPLYFEWCLCITLCLIHTTDSSQCLNLERSFASTCACLFDANKFLAHISNTVMAMSNGMRINLTAPQSPVISFDMSNVELVAHRYVMIATIKLKRSVECRNLAVYVRHFEGVTNPSVASLPPNC